MQRQVPQDLLGHIVEEIDVSVPYAREEIIEVSKPIPQERGQNSTVEHTVDVPIPQIQEETVEVPQIQSIDTAVDVPVVVQRQVSIVQKLQKTAKVPQAQFIEQVVDVPVDMSRQASAVHVVKQTAEIPQVQFIDRVVSPSVVQQRQVPAVQVAQKTTEIPQIRFIDRTVDTSVEQQWQVPTVQTIREAVEISQAQFRDKVDGMPVVVQRKVPMIQRVQKTVEVPQIQYVDKVVEAPIAAAQQPVPMDAESLWVDEVSVGTQTVSRKRKLCMETESAESADGESDVEPGGVDEAGVQGPEDLKAKAEAQLAEMRGPESELVPVAPNMGAGGSHPQATWNQEWAEDLREIRRMVEFLVQRERKLDVKADVAIRRLERLEKENLQMEDEALEASLPEALADKTKVAKLHVDKWFVDKGFGFGKAPSGEVVFIHASAVQGAEVLVIGTEAWVQVVNDDARAQGGFRARRAWGKAAWEQERERERAGRAAERARRAAALSAELAAQSERAVSEVCTHPPGLLRDEPTAEHSVAPTAVDSPSLAGGNSLSSGPSSFAPRPRGARARSIARDVDAKSSVDAVVDLYVKATGEDGDQMRQKLANMKPAVVQQNRERWQKRAEEVQRFQDKKEEARVLFRRQGGLEDDFERQFKHHVTRSVGHNREDDEKSLDKWTIELRAKAEAFEIKKMQREKLRSSGR